MLVQVLENEWILASKISGIEFHKVMNSDDWVVVISAEGNQYRRFFKDEDDACQFCLDFVGLVNGTGKTI